MRTTRLASQVRRYAHTVEPFSFRVGHEPKWTTAEQAVKIVNSGDRVFLHSAAATPQHLVQALADHGLGSKLSNVDLYHIHTEGFLPVAPEYEGVFRDHSMFIGRNAREAVREGRADFVPSFLSDVPRLFRDSVIDVDVALVSVSPPDKHGYCSLGVSVDVTRAAVEKAKVVIGQVNTHMPRVHGDGHIHISNFDALVRHDEPLHEATPRRSDVTDAIGEHVAGVIDDRSTVQLGIGAIPDAVCRNLHLHKDLGVHTEMFSDGVVELYNKGAITNAYKKIHRGLSVSSFVIGSKKVYDFVDDNPSVHLLDAAYTNAVGVIAQNPNVVAVNSALEVDLTGQVAADSLGTRMFSGVGGQVDFITGAALSEGGKPIIALPSSTSSNLSRIVPTLKEGAGVVTTRSHVHYVATEHGIVDLFGKSLPERARALISIAHPDHREDLARAAFERYNMRFFD
ncbi:MAG: hypothetical protein MHM6MM_004731 [Cercozoa sp. M6MM]